ncbi:hypothetical protein DYB32_009074 [Aphanomyces invadans]|uniref:Uncharacterized protein n=1 Tax=Aphanomyces invadans TaxID=157072 RepID=A0A418AJI2_9STRA|nr:hypothetical protein DYB32_009074 [Aphanomyces invadans]
MDHFRNVVMHQSPDLRLSTWKALVQHSNTAPVNYVHDVLRVSAYLLKTFTDESSTGYQTLTDLYASFGSPGDRGAFEALLVSTHHLPTLARLLHTIDMAKQYVILDVAADHPRAFESLLAWCHNTATAPSPHNLHSTLAMVAKTNNFHLWMDLIVNVQPSLLLTPFLALLDAFSTTGLLDHVARVFLGHSKPYDLIEPLVALVSQGESMVQSLLPHVSTESAITLISSLHPLLPSLAALATHSLHPPEKLDATIARFSRVEVSLADANHVLLFASTLPDPWPFIEFVQALATAAPHTLPRLYHVFGACNSSDQLHLVRFLLLECTTLEFGAALLNLPLEDMRCLLAITSMFLSSELERIAAFVTTLDQVCLAPLLTLLALPDHKRLHLYTILQGVDTPHRLLEALQHLCVDNLPAFDRLLHVLLLFESDQKDALATGVLHASDKVINVRLLEFLAWPPGEMDAREVLRLLRHVPSTRYESLLAMFQSPLRSKLELLVLSELLESMASPLSMECLLEALIRMDEPTLQAFFSYMEHVPGSLVVVNLIETFSSADVQLYLNLATGLSPSMMRELNLFMDNLDLRGRTAFLRVIVNPRRNILSRLIMSVHMLDHITVGNILRALEHHTWEIRSLLVEQFRILDDPIALAQLAAVHESQGTDLSTRDALETYAMIASYCSKAVQVQLASVLYRFAVPDRGELLMLVRNNAVWHPTEAIDAGSHHSQMATHLLQFLRRLDPKFHEAFLHSCKDLSADMAYFVRVFHATTVDTVHRFSAILFSRALNTDGITRLAQCLRRMHQALIGLDLAVHVLVQLSNMPSFLSYFHRLGTAQGLFVQILAEFPTHAREVVQFLESLDVDDAVLIMRRLSKMPNDNRRRFEALLNKPPYETQPVDPSQDHELWHRTRLTGVDRTLYLSVVDGCKLRPIDTRPPELSRIVTSRSLPELNPPLWSCEDVEMKLLSRKAKRVGQVPSMASSAQTERTSPSATQGESEYYTISMEPNREFTLFLASPLDDNVTSPPTGAIETTALVDNQRSKPDCLTPPEVPPPAPDPIDGVDSDNEYSSDDCSDPDVPPRRLFDHVLADSILKQHPLNTLVEEDLDVDGLPRIRIPGRCKRPSARSMRGLMPAIQNASLHPGKRRPSTSPGSPFEMIGQDANLMRWPPTRIRVARTPEAKKKVFDARVHKSMGTIMLPSLKSQQDTHKMLRTKSCVGL